MSDFGSALRGHRHDAQLTQEQLAHASGVSVEAIRALEGGRRRYPRALTVTRLAQGLRLGPDDAAALLQRSQRERDGRLPDPVGDFTGRDQQVEELRSLLTPGEASPGVVVISAIAGMGGVGKTALALHVADDLAAEFPDGRVYLNLRGFGPAEPLDPTDALTALLHQLGAPASEQASVDQLAARWRSLVAGRRLLLLLDNASNADQVLPLLPGSESCTVLVTSRRTLTTLPGSRQLTLDVLPLEESLSLLAETAGQARTAAEPDAAAELVGRCGGLPLALRIAGARLAADRGLSVAALVDQLSGERRPLDGLSAGEQDVRATIALSLAALEESGRPTGRSFARLGLYRGDVLDLMVAARLLDVPRVEAENILEELVDLHLLEGVGVQRYTMHDLVRAYARELADEQLAPADDEAAQLRILTWYEAVAWRRREQTFGMGKLIRELGSAELGEPAAHLDVPEIDRWLDLEADELVAAVRRCADGPATFQRPLARIAVALDMYWTDHRRYLDCLALYEAAGRALRSTDDPPAEALVNYDWATTLAELGRFEEAVERMRAALAAEPTARHPNHQLHCLIYLAAYLGRLGRHDEALRLAADGLAIALELSSEIPVAEARLVLGTLYGELGRYDEQDNSFRMAAESIRQVEDVRAARHWILYRIGAAYRQCARYAEASTYLQECLVIDQDYEEPARLETLQELGRSELARGRTELAEQYLRAALAMAVEHGNVLMEARVRRHLGEALSAAGDDVRAAAEWSRALELATRNGMSEAEEIRRMLAERAPITR